MQRNLPTLDELNSARLTLREWAARSALPAEYPDDILVMIVRSHAEERQHQLIIRWREELRCFAGHWHDRGVPTEKTYFGATLDDARLMGCAGLLCELPEL